MRAALTAARRCGALAARRRAAARATSRPGAGAAAPAAVAGAPARLFAALATAPSKCRVFYGSQTGTAQGFAMQLAMHLDESAVASEAVDLYDIKGNPGAALDAIRADGGAAAVFVLSCFGRGEATDSAKKFFAWLMSKDLEAQGGGRPLAGLRYAVFGLGSSQTHKEYYNVIGRAVDARLEALGAQRLHARGEGDASGESIEMDFETWEQSFLAQITACKTGGGDAAAGAAAAEPAAAAAAELVVKPLYAPSRNPYHSDGEAPFTVVPAEVPCALPGAAPSVAQASYAPAGYSRLRVSSLTNLTPGEFRPMYELRLTGDTAASGSGSAVPAYATGDHVAVQPANDDALVRRLCERAKWDPGFRFSLKPAGSGSGGAGSEARVPVPGTVTVAEALRYHVAVGAALSPLMLRLLAACADSKAESAALAALTERAAYVGTVRDGYAQLPELLERFPSIALPLDRYLATAPPLLPRYYSVSTPGGATADGSAGGAPVLDVTFRHLRCTRPAAALAGLGVPAGAVFAGTCSSYMAALQPGDEVAVAVRPSHFRLPTDASLPVVMVAGGIGIAPFRAFLLERMRQRAAGAALGPATLLYGCRDHGDQVYAQLSAQALAAGALTGADVGHAAPTCDSACGKRLADDLILQHADDVWRAVREGGTILACGGATGFGQAVIRATKAVMASKGGMSEAAAEAAMSQLLKEGRFLEDLAD